MQNQTDIVIAAPKLEADHIKEIILQYVQEESLNPYALMITGDWGSGKTYYLKNVIKSEISNRTTKELIYVTLNGVSSISEVSEQLLSELWRPAKFVKDNKIARITWRLIKSGLNVLTRASRIHTGNDNLEPIELEANDLPSITTQEFFDFSKKVIVFDDLERISKGIGISEILGFINSNFVEHDKIKVIVVCNEKEIKDGDFGKIKEKMIGRTLEFKPKTLEVATVYINGLEGNHKFFLRANEKFALNRIEQAEITNLRTLFFFFESLSAIVHSIDQDLLEAFGEEIIHQTLLLSNEYKDGRLEKYHDFEKLPTYFGFMWGAPVLHRGEEDIDKEKRDFRRKYSYEGRSSTPIIKEIHDFIRNGFLDSKNLNLKFRKRLEGEHTPEIGAILKLHPTNLHRLSNEDFIAHLSILIDSVEERKYDFFGFLGAFNIVNGFFKDNLLPIDGIELKSTEELKELFTSNVSSIRNSDPTTLHANGERRALKEFKEAYHETYPNFLIALEKEIEDYCEQNQRELLKVTFANFISNPMDDLNWREIGSFVQDFHDELIADLQDTLGNSHLKANDYAVAFGDWATEESYSQVFDRDKTEKNFSKILEEIRQFEQGLDYSIKPLNKLFNSYLIKALQQSYDKALQLSVEVKANLQEEKSTS